MLALLAVTFPPWPMVGSPRSTSAFVSPCSIYWDPVPTALGYPHLIDEWPQFRSIRWLCWSSWPRLSFKEGNPPTTGIAVGARGTIGGVAGRRHLHFNFLFTLLSPSPPPHTPETHTSRGLYFFQVWGNGLYSAGSSLVKTVINTFSPCVEGSWKALEPAPFPLPRQADSPASRANSPKVDGCVLGLEHKVLIERLLVS